MIYLDTNVIVNAVLENPSESQSSKLFLENSTSNNLISSLLLVQEVTFVLSKLGLSKESIKETSKMLLRLVGERNDAHLYNQALNLGQLAGFNNINDCIHIAIAEPFCSEFITYDKGFRKIVPYTDLKITIL